MTGWPTPSTVLGAIFTAVQDSALFADSKTFADAIPRRDVAAIVAEWDAAPPADATALCAFVEHHFVIPAPEIESHKANLPLVEHIEALWPILTRRSPAEQSGGSSIDLPHPYIVPGGRFRELYYWDSYFTMLGLVRSGQQALVESMIADFGSLLDRFGHIPNGTRTYYLSRSHPPVFHLMAALSDDGSAPARRRRLDWMRIEHRFWMDGADALAPGQQRRRAVRMPDGALLNRYWDDAAAPRDESWREDRELAQKTPGRPAAELWRDLRAAAESGWDFSSRWLGDGRTLGTIRTTRLIPIDLNCLLHGLEQAIAREARELGDPATVEAFGALARARAQAIDDHLWNNREGFYADHDLDSGGVCDQLTAAIGFALFSGIAASARAERTIAALERLLRPGGLATTLAATGQQWDAPNGWAPLQWIAVAGLRRHRRHDLAETIAERWIAMVADRHRRTGLLLEKYDVENGAAGVGGEYVTESGFGWTNGVTLELLATSTRPARP